MRDYRILNVAETRKTNVYEDRARLYAKMSGSKILWFSLFLTLRPTDAAAKSPIALFGKRRLLINVRRGLCVPTLCIRSRIVVIVFLFRRVFVSHKSQTRYYDNIVSSVWSVRVCP